MISDPKISRRDLWHQPSAIFITFPWPSYNVGGKVSEEQVFFLEGVVYFVDPKSPGSFSFLGGKERIRIPPKREHYSLDAFNRHIAEHARLKTETEKRGIGSSIDLKLCRLVKSAEGSKAFAINTKAQWNVERPLFVDSAVFLTFVLIRVTTLTILGVHKNFIQSPLHF